MTTRMGNIKLVVHGWSEERTAQYVAKMMVLGTILRERCDGVPLPWAIRDIEFMERMKKSKGDEPVA